MIRLLSSFVGPAIFLGAYVMPMLSMAENLSAYANVVADRVEARTSPEAMLESIRSGRSMREAIVNLDAHSYHARELIRMGMEELDIAIRDGESLSPLITEQLRRHRAMMETISGFLHQEKGLSR